MSIKVVNLVFQSSMPGLKTDKGLPVRDSNIRLVLLALAERADESGNRAYPGLGRLCAMTRLARQTVVSALNALRTNGYIRLQGRSRLATNQYSIVLERLTEVQPLDSAKVQPPDSEESNGRTDGLKPLNPDESNNRAGESPAAGPNPSFNRPLNPLIVNDGDAEIFRAYESEIGVLTPMIREAINGWLNGDIPRGWIREAITLAVHNNSRRWNYIEAILKNWKTRGKGSRPAAHSWSARKPERPPARQPTAADYAVAAEINAMHHKMEEEERARREEEERARREEERARREEAL